MNESLIEIESDRGKRYAREGESAEFEYAELNRAEDVLIPIDSRSIEHQAQQDLWRERMMLPGGIARRDYEAPGSPATLVQRSPNDPQPWEISGGQSVEPEPFSYVLEEEPEEFNQSHMSGTSVRVDQAGQVEAIEDPEIYEDWQIANAREVAQIRATAAAVRNQRLSGAGFMSADTEMSLYEFGMGGPGKFDAYSSAFGEYQKIGFTSGYSIGLVNTLAGSADFFYALLIGFMFGGPMGMAAAAAYLSLEERRSFRELNSPLLLAQRLRFLELLFMADGSPPRTAALIDAFQSGDKAGQHAAFITVIVAELAAGSKGVSLLRRGPAMRSSLQRLIGKMSNSTRRRFRTQRRRFFPSDAQKRAFERRERRKAQFIFDSRTGQFHEVLSGRFVSPRNLPWPDNGGFVKAKAMTVQPGTILDRFGKPTGRFLGEPGATISQRGMAPGVEKLPYTRYRVLKPFKAQVGPAAPVPEFGAVGGATQYLPPKSAGQLVAEGFLEVIP